MATDEHEFLDTVYDSYTVDTSVQTQVMRELIIQTFSPYIQGGTLLELGCSDGFMTEALSRLASEVTVIDGSSKFLADAKARNLANVSFEYGLFETYETDKKYDHIFASYILEHVVSPVDVLSNVKRFLAPGGKVYIVVPNARALSRQLALHMGLLSDLKGLTANDHNHGHRRVYDRVQLNADILACDLRQIAQGGIMLKLLSDSQMDVLYDNSILEASHIQGLYKIGLEYPDLCGSLFSICGN